MGAGVEGCVGSGVRRTWKVNTCTWVYVTRIALFMTLRTKSPILLSRVSGFGGGNLSSLVGALSDCCDCLLSLFVGTVYAGLRHLFLGTLPSEPQS